MADALPTGHDLYWLHAVRMQTCKNTISKDPCCKRAALQVSRLI